MDQNKELKKAGLKVTLPRLKILQILQEPQNQHISAEDVYKILIEQEEEIGLATVYRVLNQFDDAGILNRHHFEGGKSVFEISLFQKLTYHLQNDGDSIYPHHRIGLARDKLLQDQSLPLARSESYTRPLH